MQLTSEDHRLSLDLRDEVATLSMDGEPVGTFLVDRHETLTERTVADLGNPEGAPRLQAFERSSPQARALLRQRGHSYAAGNGELWIHAPPIHVERPARVGSPKLTSAFASPFAPRASRVARWLLLHPGERTSVSELSHAVQLSEAAVSRAIRVLADDALVSVHSDPKDARRRRIELRDPGRLLDAFERATSSRRISRQTVEVGAREVEEALRRIRKAAKRIDSPYAIGGLAGASFVRRVVDPSLTDLWIARDDIELWMDELDATPARPGSGRVTLQVAPDPYTLSIATRVDGYLVADPVQLYFDCRRQGERALEAAEAIREEMKW